MFNITSTCFSFFNNKPPASWVTHRTRDFITCYSCSYYSSMVEVKFLEFWVVGGKFANFLMSYFKLQVSFSLNFVSLFCVMRDKSSAFFFAETLNGFDNQFWFRALRSFKTLHFDWSLSCKYIKLHLKKYREVIFHDTEESCKIRRKTDLWSGKWHEEFGKFLPEHLKVSKLLLSWDPFVQSRKYIS